jgi:hypothetical protein
VPKQVKAPDLSVFLARIDSGHLEDLLVQFSDRAAAMTAAGDPESSIWAALYEYMTVSIEAALITRHTGVRL